MIDQESKINAEDKNNDGNTNDEGEFFNVVGVNNNAGSELPSTHGYHDPVRRGSLLAAAAVVLLIVKRRMNAAE